MVKETEAIYEQFLLTVMKSYTKYKAVDLN